MTLDQALRTDGVRNLAQLLVQIRPKADGMARAKLRQSATMWTEKLSFGGRDGRGEVVEDDVIAEPPDYVLDDLGVQGF